MFPKSLLLDFNRLVAAASVFTLLSSVSPSAVMAQQPTADDRSVLHLLNRVTNGPRPGDVEDVKRMGIEAFIQQQLHPERIPLPESLTAEVNNNQALMSTPIDPFKQYSPQAIDRRLGIVAKKALTEDQKTEQKEQRRDAYQKLYAASAEARMQRAVESPRQLEEVMVDFWFNHFNVSNDKGLVHIWSGAYEQQAIRPYVLGKFKDLVEATAHHPAMLFYLDNWENTKAADASDEKTKGRFKGLNENYARELMELHTLGVDGGYSQQDVIQLARILTGLGLPPQNPKAYQRGDVRIGRFGSVFDPSRHDFGDKQFLGQHDRGLRRA